MKSVMVVGDVHADWHVLNKLINRFHPDILIACGDFGYWPNGGPAYDMQLIKPQNTTILFTDGNHEDHWELAKCIDYQLVPNVFYIPRGTVFDVPGLGSTLFIGGADSIDSQYRTIGIDWFPEEILTNKDFDNIPNVHIDTVISHTCPHAFIPKEYKHKGKCNDPSMFILDRVLLTFKPKRWFFGHWHIFETQVYKSVGWECNWMVLSHSTSSRQWWHWVQK